MEASFTHDEFTKHANSKFQVQLDEHTPVELELTEISEIKLYPQPGAIFDCVSWSTRHVSRPGRCVTLRTIKWASLSYS